MYIGNVAEIIHRIAGGFEENVARCLDENRGVVLQAVKEQLYSGLNGDDDFLYPNYDNDPFFEEEGYWYHRAKAYKEWKKSITPPVAGTMIGLSARPDDVPNLFIDGTFYSEITAQRNGMALVVDPGDGNGPAILRKYGDNILTMGPSARDYFRLYYLIPSIEAFYRNCGYR